MEKMALKKISTLLFIVLFCAFFAPAFADDITLDPLNGVWKSRLVPKYRVGLLYFGYGSKMYFNSATGEASKDIALKNIHMTAPESIGISGANDNRRVFQAATAAGVIPSTVNLDPKLFYGVEKVENVPLPVAVNSYIVVKDGNNSSHDPVNTEIWIEMLTGDKENPKYKGAKKLDLTIPPTYSVNYYLDVVWHLSYTDETTTHDLAGYDWNGDGYTDYLLSYIGYINSDRGYPRAVLVLIDGKELVDYLAGKTSSLKVRNVNGNEGSSFSARDNVAYGTTHNWPSTSYRMAIGDFDGCGLPEAAIYFTKVNGVTVVTSDYNPNSLEIYKVNKDYTFSNVLTDTKAGSSVARSNAVGLAAGDVNGDGLDELVWVYAQSSPNSGFFDYWPDVAYLFANVLQFKDGKYQSAVRDKNIGTTYVMTGKDDKYASPINVAVKDIDGDGYAEAVITTTTDNKSKDPNKRYLGLWVLNWDSTNTVVFTTHMYDMNKIANSRLHPHYQRHGLAVGEFYYPEPSLKSYIAVAEIGNQTSGNICCLDWSVLEWNKEKGLKLVNKNSFSEKAEFWISPVLSAMDLYNEGLVVGEPQNIDVQDNIEVLAVVQAPPKHWDEITVDGTMYSPDSMARYNDASYAVHVGIGATKSKAESETKTSSGTWGISHSVSLGLSRNTNVDPLLDVGVSYSGAYAQKNTESNTSKVSTGIERDADKDDAIFMRSNSLRISRYPILFPESRRIIKVSDDQGNDVEAQAYIQIIVPAANNAEFSPASGRQISWYQPMHDNYNLFSYPRKYPDILGYPQKSGFAFSKKENLLMQGGDNTTFTMQLSESENSSKATSLKQTVGAHLNVNSPAMGTVFKTKIKVNLQGDYTWATDSTTTTDASKTLGITFKIPKAYIPKYGWTADDMPFRYNVSYYVQDDGAFSVGFAIPSLYKADSAIWGPYSPYNKLPDPGFLLPKRWDNTLRPYLDDVGSSTGVFYIVPNANPVNKYDMRGVSFTGKGTNIFGEMDNVAVRYLAASEPYSCDIRVINYSFIEAKGVEIKLYYQKAARAGEYPADKVEGLIPLGTKTLDIPGRSNEIGAPENWETVSIPLNWGDSVPEVGELGYVHAVVNYSEPQLNINNDHGWTLVGFYDAALFANMGNVGASAFSTIAQSEMPDIKITGVKTYALNDDGTVGGEMKPDRGRKMRIEGTVKFEGGLIEINGQRRNISHIPSLRMGLFAGKGGHFSGVLAAQELPVLKQGEEYVFSFDYDPSGINTANGAALYAFSPALLSYMQKDPNSQMLVLWRDTNGESRGGSGGCSSGYSHFALVLLVMPMLLRKR